MEGPRVSAPVEKRSGERKPPPINYPPAASRQGIVLSSRVATTLAVTVVVLLAVAFTLGLLVGQRVL